MYILSDIENEVVDRERAYYLNPVYPVTIGRLRQSPHDRHSKGSLLEFFGGYFEWDSLRDNKFKQIYD